MFAGIKHTSLLQKGMKWGKKGFMTLVSVFQLKSKNFVSIKFFFFILKIENLEFSHFFNDGGMK